MIPRRKSLVAGRVVDDRLHVEPINAPATGQPCTLLQPATESEIESALVHAAEVAPRWAAVEPPVRSEILNRVAVRLRDEAETLANLEVSESGRILQSVLNDDIECAVEAFEDAAERCMSVQPSVTTTGTAEMRIERAPHGVCVGIGAWNYPLQCATAKIAPALAAGNVIVFKPAGQTPSTASLLGQIVEEEVERTLGSSAPVRGVVQIVLGGDAVGSALAQHPLTQFVALTGSAATGVRVFQAAAPTMKRLLLELGGKSSLLILDDADIAVAVDAALHANFVAHGQLCSSASRIFVHESKAKAFIQAFVAKTSALRLGPPTDTDTEVGPLVTLEHALSVEEKVRAAADGGATVLTGGSRDIERFPSGTYFPPTVLTDVSDDSAIMQEEIFGPVACVVRFDDVDDVVRRANNTKFGLAAGVIGKDNLRALNVARRLVAGVVWVNSYGEQTPDFPFGGVRQSGVGREGGSLGFDAFSEPKTYWVEHAPEPIGFCP